MFGSKNDFFKQNLADLQLARKEVIKLLKIRKRKGIEINKYLLAYDFFVDNPNQYDGATIVKDLVDLRTKKGGYLDLDAMKHDYDYVTGANKNFIKKWKSDLGYIKNMEKNGKGIRVFRLFLLTITGLVFVPYVLIKNKL